MFIFLEIVDVIYEPNPLVCIVTMVSRVIDKSTGYGNRVVD